MIKNLSAQKLKTSALIKEAFDNLPEGVCYFDGSGVPMLVNKTMHRLVFALTKRDLQDISDLDGIMSDPSAVFPGDGTVWCFSRKTAGEKGSVTEITAADITELYRRKRELEKANAEQRDIMDRFERAGENIVSIARNEEILAMKMRVHSDLGYALGATRRFIGSGCPEEEKSAYVEGQRRMAKILLGETGNDDETDVFAELLHSVRRLGMDIVFSGELPKETEEIMTRVLRECIINTVRHAGGDKVFVRAERADGKYTAVITDNGKPPSGDITEGGGLSSLRRSVTAAGGAMTVNSSPVFSVTVALPLFTAKEDEDD